MNFIKVLIAAIAAASLVYLTFSPDFGFAKGKHNFEQNSSKQPDWLLGKWQLDHYEILGSEFQPEESEKHDFLEFQNDNTFSSASNGIPDRGSYHYDGGVISLANAKDSGALRLLVKSLSSTHLAVVIDDANDPDAQYLIIHFTK